MDWMIHFVPAAPCPMSYFRTHGRFERVILILYAHRTSDCRTGNIHYGGRGRIVVELGEGDVGRGEERGL